MLDTEEMRSLNANILAYCPGYAINLWERLKKEYEEAQKQSGEERPTNTGSPKLPDIKESFDEVRRVHGNIVKLPDVNCTIRCLHRFYTCQLRADA